MITKYTVKRFVLSSKLMRKVFILIDKLINYLGK